MKWGKNAGRCVVCERIRKMRVTPEEYARMLAAQDGCCAICGTKDPGNGASVFMVDHDHETDAIRGLLCFACNVTLGHFNDNPDRLRAAADYLERTKDEK